MFFEYSKVMEMWETYVNKARNSEWHPIFSTVKNNWVNLLLTIQWCKFWILNVRLKWETYVNDSKMKNKSDFRLLMRGTIAWRTSWYGRCSYGLLWENHTLYSWKILIWRNFGHLRQKFGQFLAKIDCFESSWRITSKLAMNIPNFWYGNSLNFYSFPKNSRK